MNGGSITQISFHFATAVIGTVATLTGMNELTRKEVEQTYRAREAYLNTKLEGIDHKVHTLTILQENHRVIFDQQSKLHREEIDKYFDERINRLNKRDRWFY